MITEADFRTALHDRVAPLLAELQPEPGLLSELRRRRARRTRWLVAGTTAAVVVVGAGTTVLARVGLDGPSTHDVVGGPATSHAPSPAATTGDARLVTGGDCAGLSVTAAVQSANQPTWRIAPGSDSNAITVPGGALMYLRAAGPCVDGLTFRTAGDLLQNASPTDPVGTFNDEGIGVVVSHDVTTAGTQAIQLWLGCAKSAGVCNGNPQEIAVVTVTVVPQASTVPDVLSLPADEAEQALRTTGFAVSSHPESSVGVPAGTVLAQAPSAGTRLAAGATVTIIVSTGTPPATCAPEQLAVDYRGVTFGTGMNFAPLAIRDTSPTACTLVGPVTIVGLDAAGRTVTNRQDFPVAPALVLTARASKLGPGGTVPSGVSIAWIPLSAQLFDAGGVCADTVVPSTWSVSIGGTSMLVPNGDGMLPTNAADNASGALGACAGRIADPGSTLISLLS